MAIAGLAVSAVLRTAGLTPLRPDQVVTISRFDWVLTCWHDGKSTSVLCFWSHSLKSNTYSQTRSKVQNRGPSWQLPRSGPPPWRRQTRVPARSSGCPTVRGCSSLCEFCEDMEGACAAAIVTATGGRSRRWNKQSRQDFQDHIPAGLRDVYVQRGSTNTSNPPSAHLPS